MTKRVNYIIRYAIDLLIIGVLVGIDQYTKLLAVQKLKDQEPFDLILGVLQFAYLENRGAAFGIFQNQKWFFILTGSGFLVAIAIALYKLPLKKKYTLLRICFVLIAAGALGNMIDRIRLNYVIDFIYIIYINFPIFNIADCYVTVATIFFVVLICFYYKEEDLDFKKAKQVKIHSSMLEEEESYDTDSHPGK